MLLVTINDWETLNLTYVSCLSLWHYGKHMIDVPIWIPSQARPTVCMTSHKQNITCLCRTSPDTMTQVVHDALQVCWKLEATAVIIERRCWWPQNPSHHCWSDLSHDDHNEHWLAYWAIACCCRISPVGLGTHWKFILFPKSPLFQRLQWCHVESCSVRSWSGYFTEPLKLLLKPS